MWMKKKIFGTGSGSSMAYSIQWPSALTTTIALLSGDMQRGIKLIYSWEHPAFTSWHASHKFQA